MKQYFILILSCMCFPGLFAQNEKGTTAFGADFTVKNSVEDLITGYEPDNTLKNTGYKIIFRGGGYLLTNFETGLLVGIYNSYSESLQDKSILTKELKGNLFGCYLRLNKTITKNFFFFIQNDFSYLLFEGANSLKSISANYDSYAEELKGTGLSDDLLCGLSCSLLKWFCIDLKINVLNCTKLNREVSPKTSLYYFPLTNFTNKNQNFSLNQSLFTIGIRFIIPHTQDEENKQSRE
ncbi:MAG: hypothetical protein HY958_05290 [Bacteroidia bacterium]|nr:hypothetical protein [Bacteroidia bacterium]